MVPLRSASVALCAMLIACDPGLEPGNPDDDLADQAGCPVFQELQTVGEVDAPDVAETSGAVLSRRFPGVLWIHNDGTAPELIAVSVSGERIAKIKLPGVTLTDWEEITIGPGPDPSRDYLYLADTGDNAIKRKSVQIVRLPEPDPNSTATPTGIERFSFTYSDGKSHDAEAIFVDPITKRLFIVTKRADESKKTHVFATRGPLGKDSGTELEFLLDEDDAPGLDGRWVGASISASGDRIMLVQHTGKNRLFLRKGKERVESALASKPCIAPRPEGQHESVALTPDGTAYFMVPEGKNPGIMASIEKPICPSWAPAKSGGRIASPFAQEISGLVASVDQPGVLWAINDSGDTDREVLLGLREDGSASAVYELTGATNEDWEDLALGPGPMAGRSYLYVGDIGDNDLTRDAIRVWRVLEPRADGKSTTTAAPLAGVDEIVLRYGDGMSHDAETLIVDPVTGDLYVVTRARKEDPDTSIHIARAPLSTSRPNVLEPVVEVDESMFGGAATGGAITADGSMMVLRIRGQDNQVYVRNPALSLGSMLLFDSCRAPGADADHDAIALSPDGKKMFMVPEKAMPQITVVTRK